MRIKTGNIVIALKISLAIIWIIVVHGIAFERKPGSFSRKDARQQSNSFISLRFLAPLVRPDFYKIFKCDFPETAA